METTWSGTGSILTRYKTDSLSRLRRSISLAQNVVERILVQSTKQIARGSVPAAAMLNGWERTETATLPLIGGAGFVKIHDSPLIGPQRERKCFGAIATSVCGVVEMLDQNPDQRRLRTSTTFVQCLLAVQTSWKTSPLSANLVISKFMLNQSLKRKSPSECNIRKYAY